jgi:ribosomal protein S18 acetylase RimI-like enzyme
MGRRAMVSKNVLIRLATPDDAFAIASMSRDLIETGLPWTWTPERVTRNIRNRNITTVVACDGEEVVGFAIMYFGDEDSHLNLIAVEPVYQRAGLGQRLIDWCKQSCFVAGIARIDAELRITNRAARAFYRKCGFRERALMPGYYSGVETAVTMTLPLRPGV